MEDVVVALVGKDNHFAFLQRSNGTWTFPSGKREENEMLGQTVLREIFEETGLTARIVRNFGARIVGGKRLHYFLCEHQAGDLIIGEPGKFRKAAWFSPLQILTLTPTVFEPVAHYLQSCRHSPLSPSLALL